VTWKSGRFSAASSVPVLRFGLHSLLKTSDFGWRSVSNAAIKPFITRQGFSPRGTWAEFFSNLLDAATEDDPTASRPRLCLAYADLKARSSTVTPRLNEGGQRGHRRVATAGSRFSSHNRVISVSY
jgi:hypothetical protein